MEIRALRETDDRSAFRSESPDLDGFFGQYAGQNQFRHHLGTTYVAVEKERILGYATVAPGLIEVDSVSARLRRKFPRYPLPILRLARIAVDGSARARGLGTALLRFTFGLAVRMSDDCGCVGVVVDAAPEAVEFYERLGFCALDVLEGRSEARPAPVAMFLPLGQIRAATEKKS